MDIHEFKILVDQEVGAEAVLSVDENSTPQTLIVNANRLTDVCTLLNKNEKSYCDLLSCVTAIDNGPDTNTMELIYHLYSIPLEHSLGLKTILSREDPKIETVSHIWKTADWHEREAFDLFGITFINHPDLRRILMPADWEGHPMRKDYVEPESYRGMKTIREEGDPV